MRTSVESKIKSRRSRHLTTGFQLKADTWQITPSSGNNCCSLIFVNANRQHIRLNREVSTATINFPERGGKIHRIEADFNAGEMLVFTTCGRGRDKQRITCLWTGGKMKVSAENKGARVDSRRLKAINN